MIPSLWADRPEQTVQSLIGLLSGLSTLLTITSYILDEYVSRIVIKQIRFCFVWYHKTEFWYLKLLFWILNICDIFWEFTNSILWYQNNRSFAISQYFKIELVASLIWVYYITIAWLFCDVPQNRICRLKHHKTKSMSMLTSAFLNQIPMGPW